jgi:hypothetical protein
MIRTQTTVRFNVLPGFASELRTAYRGAAKANAEDVRDTSKAEGPVDTGDMNRTTYAAPYEPMPGDNAHLCVSLTTPVDATEDAPKVHVPAYYAGIVNYGNSRQAANPFADRAWQLAWPRCIVRMSAVPGDAARAAGAR